MTSRAIHEIQSEVHKLAVVDITDAAESGDWVSLTRLAERLAELAQRGMYHDSLERARSMAAFAMGNHTETEPR